MESNNYQRFEAIGRLGRNPERRMNRVGEFVCEFSICVKSWERNENDEDEKRLMWIGVHAGGALGDLCNQFLTKGRLVYVAGTMVFDKYGNPPIRFDLYKTNVPRFEIAAQVVKFLDSPKEANADSGVSQPKLLNE